MTEPSPVEESLQALRLAAEKQDWNGCRTALEKLLLRLPARCAVLMTRDHVMRRLPLFERHQPGVRWPREFIESIDAEDAPGAERVWPEAEDDFPGPGANSFTSAVESLWRASLHMEGAQLCAAELVGAISGAIMAEYVEHWGSRHPREWALWYELALSGESDPRMTDIQLAMLRDPDVKRLKRAAWFEVADRLEAALRQS
ncbi:MAG TPA: hypothetical protein VF815_29320 [Myxococcaceae bacterium]|jgi:hypothetical protein